MESILNIIDLLIDGGGGDFSIAESVSTLVADLTVKMEELMVQFHFDEIVAEIMNMFA